MLAFEKIKDTYARKLLSQTYTRSSFALLLTCYLLPFAFCYWIPRAGVWLVFLSTLGYIYLTNYIFSLYPSISKTPGLQRTLLAVLATVVSMCAIIGAISQSIFDTTGVDFADPTFYSIINSVTSQNGTAYLQLTTPLSKKIVTPYSLLGLVFSGGVVPILATCLALIIMMLAVRLRRTCKHSAMDLSEPQLIVFTQDESNVRVDYEGGSLWLGDLEVELEDIVKQLAKNPGGLLCNGYNIMSMDLRKGQVPVGMF